MCDVFNLCDAGVIEYGFCVFDFHLVWGLLLIEKEKWLLHVSDGRNNVVLVFVCELSERVWNNRFTCPCLVYNIAILCTSLNI